MSKRQDVYIDRLLAIKSIYDLVAKLDTVPTSNSEVINAMETINHIVRDYASHLSGKAVIKYPQISELFVQLEKWDFMPLKVMFDKDRVNQMSFKDVRDKEKIELFPEIAKSKGVLEEIEKMFEEQNT